MVLIQAVHLSFLGFEKQKHIKFTSGKNNLVANCVPALLRGVG